MYYHRVKNRKIIISIWEFTRLYLVRVLIARNRLPFWQFVTKLSNRATFDALAFLVIKCFGHLSIGPILGDKDPWREGNIHETLIRCPMSSLSCVSVFPRATEHIFWPRNHYFQLTDPWDMRKKRIFFSKFSSLRFLYAFFDFFPFITLVIFWFQSTGHSFSPRDVIFGLREPCTTRNWRPLTFFENSIFYG